jgi:NitT/TauT family transport system substrate-binding protein
MIVAMIKKKSFILVIVLVVVSAIAAWNGFKGKSDDVSNGKEHINVQLQWFDGAQFCGLYVAKKKGFFDKEGLIVNLKPINTFTSDPIAILNENQADIAIAPADQVLISKDRGKDIKAIGTVFNKSLACYLVRRNQVSDLNDLKGKKIAVFKKFDTENILLSMLRKNNITIDTSKIVQAGQLESFIDGDVDVYGSYVINEPIDIKLLHNPIDAECIVPENYNVHFYSDTYVVKTDYWKKNKDNLLVRFMRAANEGWEYAKKHPDEAINIMFEEVHNISKIDQGEKQKRALRVALKYIGDGPDKHVSYMLKDRWNEMEKDLNAIGRISHIGYTDDLCDFELNEKAYGKR